MNPTSERLREIFRATRTIAVVGYSRNPARASHWIAEYLKERGGYRVIPVNPGVESALGERCYRTLAEVPDAVDLVDVFRTPSAVPEVVDHAIRKGAKVVWMQEGAEHEGAADAARKAGLDAVVGRCIFRDHSSLVGGG
ncbi:MAG TPA: CoA-binding protein [Planctomycetota bacterium]|nr:CoA-binding protein [Planctomycetota bacterium]